MNICGVIFDLDGTLVYYSVDRNKLRSELLNRLRLYNIPLSSFLRLKSIWSIIKNFYYIAESNGLDNGERRRILFELYSIIEKYELDAAKKLSLIPGALTALKYVRNMGYKSALYTLCGRKPTLKVLERFDLMKFFDAVITRDDVENVKPHPEHLLKAISILNVKPREVVVVGDSVLDAECAKNIGAIFIGVKTGVRSEAELRASGADYILNSVSELPSLLYLLSSI